MKPIAAPSPASAVPNGATRMKFAVHGHAVEVDVDGAAAPQLAASVRRLLGPFAVAGWPDGFAPVHGTVRPYEHAEVMRHLSSAARPLPLAGGHGLLEVFQEGERFWLVDDRWGMAEINFLKGQWRTWLLPRPQVDTLRCAETAVLWPLAQLLRPRGLYLLPAASFVRDGWAALALCPFGLGPELAALARAGWKVIGQRWTAAREEEGRVALLHVPGWIEFEPRVPGGGGPAGAPNATFDLHDLHPHRRHNHAFCDAVLVAGPGRRAHAGLKEVTDAPTVAAALRAAWPIPELHPSRRHSALPTRLAQLCQCAELQLSRDASELLPLLDSIRDSAPPAPAFPPPPRPGARRLELTAV